MICETHFEIDLLELEVLLRKLYKTLNKHNFTLNGHIKFTIQDIEKLVDIIVDTCYKHLREDENELILLERIIYCYIIKNSVAYIDGNRL